MGVLPWQEKPPLVGAKVNLAHPDALGLELCYLFNEGGGNIIRDVAKQHHATIGLSTINHIVGGQAGSGALQSTATTSTTQGIVIAPNNFLSFTVVTIECILINDGSDTYGCILSRNDGGRGFLTHNSGVGYKLDLKGSGGTDIDSATILTHGVEYHIIASVNSSNTIFSYYVNGVLDSAPSAGSNTLTYDTMLNSTASDTFIGKLKLLRLYSLPVSAERAWRLAHDPWDMFEPSPLVTPSRGSLVTFGSSGFLGLV